MKISLRLEEGAGGSPYGAESYEGMDHAESIVHCSCTTLAGAIASSHIFDNVKDGRKVGNRFGLVFPGNLIKFSLVFPIK